MYFVQSSHVCGRNLTAIADRGALTSFGMILTTWLCSYAQQWIYNDTIDTEIAVNQEN